MDNIINTKNKWALEETQYANRFSLLLNGYLVAKIEHYTESQDKINKNILDALNNYDDVLD